MQEHGQHEHREGKNYFEPHLLGNEHAEGIPVSSTPDTDPIKALLWEAPFWELSSKAGQAEQAQSIVYVSSPTVPTWSLVDPRRLATDISLVLLSEYVPSETLHRTLHSLLQETYATGSSSKLDT